MANRRVAFQAEAGAVTFILLSSAFRELAAAIREADPKGAHALLLQHEESIVTALQQFEDELRAETQPENSPNE